MLKRILTQNGEINWIINKNNGHWQNEQYVINLKIPL